MSTNVENEYKTGRLRKNQPTVVNKNYFFILLEDNFIKMSYVGWVGHLFLLKL